MMQSGLLLHIVVVLVFSSILLLEEATASATVIYDCSADDHAGSYLVNTTTTTTTLNDTNISSSSCSPCPNNTYSWQPDSSSMESCKRCGDFSHSSEGSTSCTCDLGLKSMMGASSDMEGASDNSDTGISVAISGDGSVSLVGAPLENAEAGIARAYRWNSPGGGVDSDNNNNKWNRLGGGDEMRMMAGTASGERCGSSVSLSYDGSIALVGCDNYASSGGGMTQMGTARAYVWNGYKWDQLGSDADMAGSNLNWAGSGVSLSSDGTVALVGSPQFDSSQNQKAGTARAYRWDSPVAGAWNQMGLTEDMQGLAPQDTFGYSVSISGDGSVALVGSNRFDGVGARAFRWNTPTPGRWNELGSPGQIGGDVVGASWSVSLSSRGDVALVGFPRYQSWTGTAAAYKWNDPVAGRWNRLGSSSDNDMIGSLANEQAGRSVSLSADGNMALVGAQFYRSGGINSRGTARMYEWNRPTVGRWNRVGSDSDMQGEKAAEINGVSCSLSHDATVALLGSTWYNGAGYSRGTARGYKCLAAPCDAGSFR